MRRLMGWAWTERGWLMLAVLAGVVTVGSAIGLMGTSAYIIAAAARHPSVAVLSVAVVGVRFFGVARGVGRYVERLTSHEATFRILARVRTWWYSALEPLAPARLAGWHTGDLLSRATGDVDALQYFFARGVAPVAVAVLTTVGSVAFLWRFSTPLAVGVGGFLVVAGGALPMLAFRLSRVPAAAVARLRAALLAHAVDGVQGAAELVAYGHEAVHLARQGSLDRAYAQAQRQLTAINAVNAAGMLLLTNGAVLLVLLCAIPMVVAHRLDGVLLAVLALVAQASFEAVAALPEAWQQIAGARAASDRLAAVVAATPAEGASLAPAPLPMDRTLRAQHLTFRYAPDGPLALRDISFTLPPGGHLVLVGPSGGGKSTLGRLLLRLWDAPAGALTLGGADLSALAADEVRSCFAVIEQDPHIFNGTVRQNLLLARTGATEDEIIAAAQRARLHEVVLGLPQGYDTPLGEGGQRLSDGERQRIAITRAILRDAPILLLDEATAYLDLANERAVLAGLRAAMQGRTVIRITHRLVAMAAATEILVLEGGCVTERGTHAQLVAQAGRYAELWHATQTAQLPEAVVLSHS
ncbi:MAG: thiol reductant ABC exporter subunit CydC [Ktedonobacterales bacterium]|nr:thiol reductant ABC exporter subunit CydC [Ktedonobacterales bacterium]